MTREEIGAILRELRINSGKTQKEVAEILGRKQQIVGHWETGYSQPDADTLFTLCDIYGTTVDEAFGFKKDAISITRKDITLLDKFHSLDAYGKDTVSIILDRETDRTEKLAKLSSYIAKLESKNNNEFILNAAYDDGATEEEKAAADRIMMDDSEWE